MASFRTLDDLGDVAGKRVLVRVDLNVPMQDGAVSDDTRLRATLPTVTELADKGAIVLLLAHFGRPKGERRPDMSLALVTRPYSDVLGRPVRFIDDCCGEGARAAIATLAPATSPSSKTPASTPARRRTIRLWPKPWPSSAMSMSTTPFPPPTAPMPRPTAIARLLPAYAGRAMEQELKALERALGDPERPVAAVVGGAKVSTKLDVLRHLVGKVDHLIIGGGMANTFLAARGIDIGRSLAERDLAAGALDILDSAERANCIVHLPYDVVVAKALAPHPPSLRTCNVHEVAADEMILDIGPAAVEALADALKTCPTLVWNGPLGAFETPPFDAATVALARFAAALTQEGSLVSVAGGGDTVAALNQAGVTGDFTFVSTAGGAFLEWMEGRTLPGVAALSADEGPL